MPRPAPNPVGRSWIAQQDIGRVYSQLVDCLLDDEGECLSQAAAFGDCPASIWPGPWSAAVGD